MWYLTGTTNFVGSDEAAAEHAAKQTAPFVARESEGVRIFNFLALKARYEGQEPFEVHAGEEIFNNPDPHNVHAGDIEIPAGKVLLKEYRDIADSDPRAVPQTIAKADMARLKRPCELVAIPAGWAIAGSAMRWDNGCYGVRFEMDGATHGRRFAAYADAQALFDKWTTEE